MNKNEVLDMNISDFLKKMAAKGKLETKFVLDKAINTFEYNELQKACDVLSFEDGYGPRLRIAGGPRHDPTSMGKNGKGRYMGRTKYGWKTHEFVKACFKIAGIDEKEFGIFLSKKQ